MYVRVHSVSALIKFHTSISKSVTVHFGIVQGQTLQVEMLCMYIMIVYLWHVQGQTLQVDTIYITVVYLCIFVVCTGTDITGRDALYHGCIFVACTGTNITVRVHKTVLNLGYVLGHSK